jgi:hypothetical protein
VASLADIRVGNEGFTRTYALAYLQVRPGEYPKGKQMKGAPHGKALAKKGLIRTNVLAYFPATMKKSFYNVGT